MIILAQSQEGPYRAPLWAAGGNMEGEERGLHMMEVMQKQGYVGEFEVIQFIIQ